MFWVMMALLVAAGFLLRRRETGSTEDEPWRASIEAEGDEAPLDIEEIRRAEEEWLAGSEWNADSGDWSGEVEDEEWR